MNKIFVSPVGNLTCSGERRVYIQDSPVGVVVAGGCAYAPVSAVMHGSEADVRYACGTVRMRIEERAGYHRLTVVSVPEGTERFIFGPYRADGADFGDILGASWHEDGSVVCVQSLMPKVESGIPRKIEKNETGLDLSICKPAAIKNGTIRLQLSVGAHTKEEILDTTGLITGYNGSAKAVVSPIPGEDGRIEGAAIAIAAANSADELLDIIHDMELAEGLPHSTFNGNWAKQEKQASSIYLIFGGAGLSAQERISMAERAGVSCVYLSDMLGEWGHFTIDEKCYPGGVQEIKALAERANANGLYIGTHTLSNFITTGDAFVTPVPDPGLLAMDRTGLAEAISAEATEIRLTDAANYALKSTLNTLRIGEELITYDDFDKEMLCLTGCTRGAYGTTASAHAAGERAYRLWDHGYRTLFPDLILQREMADHMSRMILECGVTRLSFDGLEGCQYPGVGEYGMNEFVRRVFENVEGKLVCDASLTGNYLWHAFSYSNWGEPWYDSARRGSMHALRKGHQSFFRKNLIAPMMGWYQVCAADGKFEATPPENMEYMLSRSAAFDAGLAVSIKAQVARDHGLIGEYMDYIRLWEDFRFRADIPEKVRELLQDEETNWHLEKDGDGWKLTQLIVRQQDLDYGDRNTATEAGMVYQDAKADVVDQMKMHSSLIVLDRTTDDRSEPFCFRIRVGRPGRGCMKDLEIVYEDDERINADGTTTARQKFAFTAEGGDYLEYHGDGILHHYDKNFRLKEVLESNGRHIRMKSFSQHMYLNYATDPDDTVDYIFTEFRRKAEYMIRPKQA
ncbi:MAG: hypothetical protein Q4A66_08080 [Eubacteriales bacterium]|nr:hypothetical protein [Eubacteriales bacterium]